MKNVFDLATPEVSTKSDAAPAARLAPFSTVSALAEFVVGGKRSSGYDEATGLVSIHGVSARGYGAVAFPVEEALSFCEALDALANGASVTPEPVTLDTLAHPVAKPTMRQNLLAAEPYHGVDGTVHALKLAGSNHEGSAKPKATLIALSDGFEAICWYVAASACASEAVPEHEERLAGFVAKYAKAGKALTAAVKAAMSK